MNRRVRVPVRVTPRAGQRYPSSAEEPAVVEAAPPVSDRDAAVSAEDSAGRVGYRRSVDAQDRRARRDTGIYARPEPEPAVPRPDPETQDAAGDAKRAGEGEGESLEMWRDRALRLQAEIENFRKRQQRLAEEQVVADRERLLRAFLSVTDDLERALNTDGADIESLRQGVDLTHQAMMKLLDREGVEPIQAAGQPFDPSWHEAVGTIPHEHTDAEPDTVAQVVQPGYRLGDRLLRPARVIVAA
jgi:molecular chaperone GrpE